MTDVDRLKFSEVLTGGWPEEKLMFDFLKKKISGFIDGITKKEEQKAEAEPKEAPVPPIEEEAETAPKEEKPAKAPEPEVGKQVEAPKPEAERKPEPREERKPEPVRIKQKPEPPAIKPEPAPMAVAPKPEPVHEVAAPKPAPIAAPPKPEAAKPAVPAPAPKMKEPEARVKKPEPVPVIREPEPAPMEKEPQPAPRVKEPEPPEQKENGPQVKKAAPAPKPEPRAPSFEEKEKPKERLKLGIVGTVKSLITREVEITEKDVKDMVESLELELLEADVDIGVSESIKEELMGKLIGAKVGKDKLHSYISGSIKETLVDILTNEKDFDIVSRVESSGEKPVKIMFIGINGAGKTTTIAKVAKLLMGANRKVVFAAADTFRAAAIEQMGVHAERLGVKMIKREYGSDPTSVAYDAVNYAKAHAIDAVLIDTAGRQDTNISLLNEMKKMKRVIKPDICIYIGESIAGNAILEQISAFNREVGVDAVILSKLDCDPKGGTMLSISKATGVPIIYVGVGQGYDALERFDPKAIVSRIVE